MNYECNKTLDIHRNKRNLVFDDSDRRLPVNTCVYLSECIESIFDKFVFVNRLNL